VAWTKPDAAVPVPPPASPEDDVPTVPVVDEVQTVPMTETTLVELLSDDAFDSDAVTTVPCPPPEPTPARRLRWRKRAQ
jgi:hypothetical protein